jgi:hypothetical protein
LFCFIEHNEGLTTHLCYAMWQLERGSYKANIDVFTADVEVFKHQQKGKQCSMTVLFVLYH